MIETKIFAGTAMGTGLTYLAAVVGDAPTVALTWVGILGALGTTLVGAYAAFRAAKHRADLQDSDLLQQKLRSAEKRLAQAERRVRSAEEQGEQWKALYHAAVGGSKDHPIGGSPP